MELSHRRVTKKLRFTDRNGNALKEREISIKQDRSRKPSFEMLKKLVKQEWWTDQVVQTDDTEQTVIME